MLFRSYQGLTMTDVAPVRRRGAGGAGKKRGPRSLDSILSTATTRMLNEEHKAGHKKAQALNAAMDRASLLAVGRKETLTDAINASISAKADPIWGKK